MLSSSGSSPVQPSMHRPLVLGRAKNKQTLLCNEASKSNDRCIFCGADRRNWGSWTAWVSNNILYMLHQKNNCWVMRVVKSNSLIQGGYSKPGCRRSFLRWHWKTVIDWQGTMSRQLIAGLFFLWMNPDCNENTVWCVNQVKQLVTLSVCQTHREANWSVNVFLIPLKIKEMMEVLGEFLGETTKCERGHTDRHMDSLQVRNEPRKQTAIYRIQITSVFLLFMIYPSNMTMCWSVNQLTTCSCLPRPRSFSGRCFIRADSAGLWYFFSADTATTSLQPGLQPVWNSPEEGGTEAEARQAQDIIGWIKTL